MSLHLLYAALCAAQQVGGLGIALAVLDEARAEEASCAMSVARVDGVPKRTGGLGHPLAVVFSTGTGTRIQEV